VPGGPYCGTHCACEGHGRRSSRGGPVRGVDSENKQLFRRVHQKIYIPLQEAVNWIVSTTPDVFKRKSVRFANSQRNTLLAELTTWMTRDVEPEMVYNMEDLPTLGMLNPTMLGRMTDCLPRGILSCFAQLSSYFQEYSGRRRAEPREEKETCSRPSSHAPIIEPLASHSQHVEEDVEPPSPVFVCIPAPKWEWQDLPGRPAKHPGRHPLAPIPHGRFLWNFASGKPAPHIRRIAGQGPVLFVQRGKLYTTEAFANTGAPVPTLVTPALSGQSLGTMLQWLQLRTGLAKHLRNWREGNGPGEPWGYGDWFHMAFQPRIPERTSIVDFADYRNGYHGTSLYVLHRVTHTGMETGFASVHNNQHEFKGIFNHSQERVHLCQHYMLYTPLDDTGYYWAPLLTLQYPERDPQGRATNVKRSTASMKQWLTYEDVCELTGVWFHRIHWTDMLVKDRAHGAFMEGRFCRGLELDPYESKEKIHRRSSDERHQDIL